MFAYSTKIDLPTLRSTYPHSTKLAVLDRSLCTINDKFRLKKKY